MTYTPKHHNNRPSKAVSNGSEFLLTPGIAFVPSVTMLKNFEAEHIDGIEAFVFLYCTGGDISIQVNGETLHAGKRDLLVCPYNSLIGHYTLSADFDCSVLALTKEFFFSVISQERIKWSQFFKQNTTPVTRLDDEMARLADLYMEMLRIRRTMYRGTQYGSSIEHLVLSLLSELGCYAEKTGIVQTLPQAVRQYDVIFKNFIAMLSSDSTGIPSRSVAYYADQLAITPKYLSAICKICTKSSASHLINEFLSKRIEHLLLHSDLTIKEIAMKLDFPDVSNFGRYVKGRLGRSPRAIREE